jgi:NAD(P)-dependent dehydrogenase (short-subunit alcohol dehydrogenase family)
MKIKVLLLLLELVVSAKGWAFRPAHFKKVKALARNSLMAGAAGGFLVGAAAAAGAAVVVNEQINNQPSPYELDPNSMSGKVVLITGGTSGLGLESAKRLGAAGATVILSSRSTEKGIEAVEAVRKYIKARGMADTNIFSLSLDLDDLSSVKAFPDSYALLSESLGLKGIDVLLNNAGVMAIPDRQLTVDGYERQFQSNHLGHFALTAGLFPFLSRDGATVINVSSEAYKIARSGLDIDNLNGEKSYSAWPAYGQSKLANILFTRELQRRAKESGDFSWLTAVTLHPGAVSTDLGRYFIGEIRWKDFKASAPAPLESLVSNALLLVTKTVQEGASTQIFLAAGAEGKLQPGAYYSDCRIEALESCATNSFDAERLWEKSEELTGINFKIGSSVDASSATPASDLSKGDDKDETDE